MAEETLQLVPPNDLGGAPVSYVVDFNGQQRMVGGIKHRMGRSPLSGPVAQKIATSGTEARLRRELDVARYLGPRGGELLSKCLGCNFNDLPASAVVTYRGRPLADLVREEANWPLDHAFRAKIITDLLQGLELLRVSSVVHGSIGMDTLHWDGTTLQITEFGQAALSGKYPDGRPAHHGDDIHAAGRVIYYVYTGQPPPDEPAALREQIEQVHDVELCDLLLRRDLATGADVDYVFAEDRDRRPTSQVLLERLDRRPHGIQWQHVVATDQKIRQDFRHLRDRQRQFRRAYASWLTHRSLLRPLRINPGGAVPAHQPASPSSQGTVRQRRVRVPKPAWAVLAGVAVLAFGLVLLLGL